MPSWFDPSTGLMVAAPNSGTTIGAFNGALPIGSVTRLSDLVKFSRGDTIILQHVSGTGLFSIGPSTPPPVWYDSSGFEVFVPGPIIGQGGWTVGWPVPNSGPGVWTPGVRAGALMSGSRYIGDGPPAAGYCYQSHILGAGGSLDAGTQPFAFVADVYLSGTGTINREMNIGPMASESSGNPFMMRWMCKPDATFTMFDATFPVGIVTPVAAGIHRIMTQGDGAGNLTHSIDGVVIGVGTPLNPIVTVMHFDFRNTNPGDPGVDLIGLDNLSLTGPTGFTAGLHITDGGERTLNANLIYWDLSQLVIAVDPLAGAPAGLEILVNGA